MQAAPARPELPDPDTLAAQRAADVQSGRATLHALTGLASDIAHRIHARIVALPEPVAPPEPPEAPEPAAKPAKPVPDPIVPLAAAFDDTARTARQCLMLLQRITAPAADAPPPRPTAAQRTAARSQIIRAVEDTIQREVEGERELNFGYELDERLDLLDVDGAITARPPAAIIKEILRDMGLDVVPGTRPWKRRTPPAIVELATWAADPPKPFTPRTFPTPELHSSA